MLVCTRCNWSGTSLVPDYEKNTANCPKCGQNFDGIPAENAIHRTNAVKVSCPDGCGKIFYVKKRRRSDPCSSTSHS